MTYHIKMVSILISFIFRPKHRLLASSDLKTEHTAVSVALANGFVVFGDLNFPLLNCLPPPQPLTFSLLIKKGGSIIA